MIYYWIHIIYIYLGSRFFWKKVELAQDLSRNRTVSIWDCDFRFMANSKYFYYMDFIRLEILFRSKLYDHTIAKGMFPVLGSQKIIYKKPLRIWTKFKISLVLEGWDDKWIYHKQIFRRNDEIYAIGITKVAFWKNKKTQNTREIIGKSGVDFPEMSPSPEILRMFENDYQIIQQN
ncbi:acyl-CoA thioesterase [Christiangramia sabulilitoris]|uniref:Acyl-CoA thioesterase n=1 Tax=Christiangramia sabulilitoris TaxID=2583991 RepID=A0A550I3F8_9FLAO|nr:acyl-CoA thioesterase [Christiangramia sabulilitoris]TRO65512.1 acyl-CoA thioesterase [Christiangramia sabulilitoris]